MYVKIIHNLELPVVTMFQCHNIGISHDEHGNTTLCLDDESRVFDFKDVTDTKEGNREWQVFIMNDEGKTIDKIMM